VTLGRRPRGGDRPAPRGRPLRNPEFRALILAQVTSEVGDHFARVAVAGIVLERSHSAFYAAATFVLGYLPGIAGSALLGPLADRLSRRRLMLGCDMARVGIVALLVLLVGLPVPLWVLMGVLLAAELFSAPFDAARTALVPDVLPDPRDYLAGTGMSRVLFQANQVAGLTAAGVVVYAVSARAALVVDVATFVASFVILLVGLRDRPAPASSRDASAGLLADVRDAARLIFTDRLRRNFVLMGWGAAVFLIAPEGVALAYAAAHGSPELGGALMAAIPAGAVIGSLLVSRLEPARAVRAIRPLLLAGCLPLLLTWLDQPIGATLALWLVAGMGQAFLVPVVVVVNLVTPASRRGRVNGVAAAGFNVATALAFLLAGMTADAASPAVAVTAAGVVGLGVLLLVHRAWPAAELEATFGSKRPARPGGRLTSRAPQR